MTRPGPSDPLSTLAVVVVNFGTHRLVETNLDATLDADFPGQIVVVDNHRDDAERAAITALCRRRAWTLVPLAENRGFGGGNNRGVDVALRAGASTVLLLNPDARLEPEGLRRLHERAVAEPMTLFAPVVQRPSGRLYSTLNDLHLDRGDMRWTHLRAESADPDRIHTWVSGACLMLSARLWRASGGFDEEYFLYWEDVDLSRRVVQAGGEVAVVPEVVAVHDEGGSQRSTTAGGGKSPLYYFYNARNRLRYAGTHLARRDRWRWVAATPRECYRLAVQGGRRQLLDPRRSLWPAVRGGLVGVGSVVRPRR